MKGIGGYQSVDSAIEAYLRDELDAEQFSSVSQVVKPRPVDEYRPVIDKKTFITKLMTEADPQMKFKRILRADLGGSLPDQRTLGVAAEFEKDGMEFEFDLSWGVRSHGFWMTVDVEGHPEYDYAFARLNGVSPDEIRRGIAEVLELKRGFEGE